MNQLSNPEFLLILIIPCLGACLVWAFCEIEIARGRVQQRRGLVREARRFVRSNR